MRHLAFNVYIENITDDESDLLFDQLFTAVERIVCPEGAEQMLGDDHVCKLAWTAGGHSAMEEGHDACATCWPEDVGSFARTRYTRIGSFGDVAR